MLPPTGTLQVVQAHPPGRCLVFRAIDLIYLNYSPAKFTPPAWGSKTILYSRNPATWPADMIAPPKGLQQLSRVQDDPDPRLGVPRRFCETRSLHGSCTGEVGTTRHDTSEDSLRSMSYGTGRGEVPL